MKKNFAALTLTFILIAFSFVSWSQSKGSYYIVTLQGSVVKNVLETYSTTFSYFDFTFKPYGKGFVLEGYAKDKDSAQLGSLISFIPVTSHPPKPLNNLMQGHLYLTLQKMQEQNVDGSEDYILSPKKCKDKSGNDVDYVSYIFSNKAYKTTSFFLTPPVREFTLNPSPPY